MKKRYRIAEITTEIAAADNNDLWRLMERCYEPFVIAETDATAATVNIQIVEGLEEMPSGMALLYDDVPAAPDMPSLYAYRDGEGCLCFRIVQPGDTKERAFLKLSADFANATIHIEKKGYGPRPWQAGASLTAMIQLAYHFGAQPSGNLMSHASCVLKDGKAYLFLGKSGTGKSTHSRMWMEAFPDAELLNDDHPILRLDPTGKVTSYGSPWSGKTPCYKNLYAPVGGIVRIRRGATNSIRRLQPVEAYASLMTSVFNAPFDRKLTDLRHRLIEGIVTAVPCYELKCLPDTDAARVCRAGMDNK